MRKINNWVPEVQSLLATLVKHGCKLHSGDNGEDRFNFEGEDKLEQFIENLIACDEAHLYVVTPEREKPKYLFLVLGNSPGELVCDYVVDATLDKVTEEHYNQWEGRKQPTKEVA